MAAAKKTPSFAKFFPRNRHLAERAAFFYRNAGSSYDPKKETMEHGSMRQAMKLAEAEAEAKRRDWTVEWENDELGWSDLQTDVRAGDRSQEDADYVKEILVAVLKDENGKVLGSLGSVEFGSSHPENVRYGLVVEAELALEALGELGWKWVSPKGF